MPRYSKPRCIRNRCSGTKSEAEYWGFIRSHLRQASRRWKPVYDTLAGAKRPSRSNNLRLKWEYLCAGCGGWFPQKAVCIDHIIACGPCGPGTVETFISRLLCEKDNLQVLCDTCHLAKTKEERIETLNAGH